MFAVGVDIALLNLDWDHQLLVVLRDLASTPSSSCNLQPDVAIIAVGLAQGDL